MAPPPNVTIPTARPMLAWWKIAIIIAWGALLTFAVVSLFGKNSSGEPPVAGMVAPRQSGFAENRAEAMSRFRAVADPLSSEMVVGQEPGDDGYSCDSLAIRGVLFRVCGRGNEAIESVVASGKSKDRGRRYEAMAIGVKALMDVADNSASAEDVASMHRAVSTLEETESDGRACTPAACIKVTFDPEMWFLVMSAPTR